MNNKNIQKGSNQPTQSVQSFFISHGIDINRQRSLQKRLESSYTTTDTSTELPQPFDVDTFLQEYHNMLNTECTDSLTCIKNSLLHMYNDEYMYTSWENTKQCILTSLSMHMPLDNDIKFENKNWSAIFLQAIENKTPSLSTFLLSNEKDNDIQELSNISLSTIYPVSSMLKNLIDTTNTTISSNTNTKNVKILSLEESTYIKVISLCNFQFLRNEIFSPVILYRDASQYIEDQCYISLYKDDTINKKSNITVSNDSMYNTQKELQKENRVNGSQNISSDNQYKCRDKDTVIFTHEELTSKENLQESSDIVDIWIQQQMMVQELPCIISNDTVIETVVKQELQHQGACKYLEQLYIYVIENSLQKDIAHNIDIPENINIFLKLKKIDGWEVLYQYYPILQNIEQYMCTSEYWKRFDTALCVESAVLPLQNTHTMIDSNNNKVSHPIHNIYRRTNSFYNDSISTSSSINNTTVGTVNTTNSTNSTTNTINNTNVSNNSTMTEEVTDTRQQLWAQHSRQLEVYDINKNSNINTNNNNSNVPQTHHPSTNMSIWAVLFWQYRSGSHQAVRNVLEFSIDSSLLKENSTHLLEIQTLRQQNQGTSINISDKLWYKQEEEFQSISIDTSDPYRILLYQIIGYCIVDINTLINIISAILITIEDYLWYRQQQIWYENILQPPPWIYINGTKRVYPLYQQNSLKNDMNILNDTQYFDNILYGTKRTIYTNQRIQLQTQQFEKAIIYTLHNQHRVQCQHLCICLSLYSQIKLQPLQVPFFVQDNDNLQQNIGQYMFDFIQRYSEYNPLSSQHLIYMLKSIYANSDKDNSVIIKLEEEQLIYLLSTTNELQTIIGVTSTIYNTQHEIPTRSILQEQYNEEYIINILNKSANICFEIEGPTKHTLKLYSLSNNLNRVERQQCESLIEVIQKPSNNPIKNQILLNIDEYIIATKSNDQIIQQQILLVSKFFSKINYNDKFIINNSLDQQTIMDILVLMEKMGFIIIIDTYNIEYENKEWHLKSLQHPKYIERRKNICDTVVKQNINLLSDIAKNALQILHTFSLNTHDKIKQAIYIAQSSALFDIFISEWSDSLDVDIRNYLVQMDAKLQLKRGDTSV